MSKLVRPDLKFREDRGSSLCPMIIVDRTISGPDSPLWAHSGRKLCAAPKALRGPNQSRGCASGGGLRNGSQRAHRVASPCLSDPSPLQGPALTHGFRSRTRTDDGNEAARAGGRCRQAATGGWAGHVRPALDKPCQSARLLLRRLVPGERANVRRDASISPRWEGRFTAPIRWPWRRVASRSPAAERARRGLPWPRTHPGRGGHRAPPRPP